MCLCLRPRVSVRRARRHRQRRRMSQRRQLRYWRLNWRKGVPDCIVNSLPGVVIMLAATLIGAIAYRRNNTKQLREIQNQVIETYKSQFEVQERQIAHLKQENVAMRLAFKQLGMEIEIDGDTITLIDAQVPKKKRIMQVRAEQDETAKEN